MNTTTEGLLKLLMYGAYVRAKRMANANMPVKSIVKGDLRGYPYKRKANVTMPYFTPMDLSYTHNKDFFPALTDSGLCQVYNGDAMGVTYSPRNKTKELASMLDPRTEFVPKMITGTGKISERTFWIPIGERYMYSD